MNCLSELKLRSLRLCHTVRTKRSSSKSTVPRFTKTSLNTLGITNAMENKKRPEKKEKLERFDEFALPSLMD